MANRAVDNTAPVPQDVQGNNGSGTAGKVDAGDTLAFTWSEPLQPASVLSGWNGTSSASVSVHFVNSGNADQIEVWNAASTAQLPFTTGGALTGKKLVTASTNWAATMTVSGGVYTITLTTGDATKSDNSNPQNLSWPVAAGFLDPAGNASVAKTVTESGSKSAEF